MQDGFLPEDIFTHILGGGLPGFGGFEGLQRLRGGDTTLPLKVSLEDLYNGKISQIEHSKNVICSDCNGRGGRTGALAICKNCNGCGVVITYASLMPGVSNRLKKACNHCAGRGKVINEEDLCKVCEGRKVVKQTKMVEVHIAKGMHHSQKICLRGEGHQEPGIEPGDVFLMLLEQKHDVFTRSGNDLRMEHSISLTEALCGFSLVVKHLDGRDLHIKYPPGQIVKPGDIKAVIGEGMPREDNPTQKGNLHICFNVHFPDNHFTSEEYLGLIETILPARTPFVMPEGEHVEEVDLTDYVHRERSSREEAYASDDEAEGHNVQCVPQ